MSFFKDWKRIINECYLLLRNEGIRAVFRRYGWRVFVVVFFYYLIRDSIIYLLIPYMVTRHFFD